MVCEPASGTHCVMFLYATRKQSKWQCVARPFMFGTQLNLCFVFVVKRTKETNLFFKNQFLIKPQALPLIMHPDSHSGVPNCVFIGLPKDQLYLNK